MICFKGKLIKIKGGRSRKRMKYWEKHSKKKQSYFLYFWIW